MKGAHLHRAPAEPLYGSNLVAEAREIPLRHGRIHQALRTAALGHDIERAVEARKVWWGDLADYDAYNATHPRHSAPLGAARSIVVGLELGDPLRRLMNESTKTARVLRKSGEPC